MNLYDYFKKNVHIAELNNFTGDIYDLAIVRYVMKEAAKIFYHDYTFFLDKENLNAREKIYDKETDVGNLQDFSVVCKSYCNIIKEILEKNYGISSSLVSPSNDKFRHVDLLITTTNGHHYIVDPLTDLVEMQLGLKTKNFASKSNYDKLYAGRLKDISFLSDENLEEIDDKIHYRIHSMYLNDFFEMLRTEFEHIEEFLEQNEILSNELLGKKYEGEIFSEDEKTQLKLEFIYKHMNNRKVLNGFVDLIIFSNLMSENLFSKDEQKKIRFCSFFVDETDLKDQNLIKMLEGTDTRKRGRVISFNGQNYIFSLGDVALKYNDDEWQRVIEENSIFIKPYYPVQLLGYLKGNGVDRNVLHNNEFLRLFRKFELDLLRQGKDLETIKRENIFIQGSTLFTQLRGQIISYKIEDGNLSIRDYKKNLKQVVYYRDEGRDISYQVEPILKESERVHLYEFDSNGLIVLENVTRNREFSCSIRKWKILIQKCFLLC